MNQEILEAIDAQIATLRQVREILAASGKTARTTSAVSSVKPRRQLSAKARSAIADAQRKRWAKVHSQKKAAAATSAKKDIAS